MNKMIRFSLKGTLVLTRYCTIDFDYEMVIPILLES